MINSKRAQLYLLTVIILSLLVFLMADLPAKTEEGSREPILLYQNFVSQMPMVINSAVYNSKNLTLDVDDYSGKFITHSATKNINLSLFYVIQYNSSIFMRNRMGSDINATLSDRTYLIENSNSILISPAFPVDKIRIMSSGIDYDFNLGQGRTDFKVIFRTVDARNNIEVYTYG
ncbi:MAG: hypothetical protein KKE20_00220 [Nanoarchaeota archaeon]|nr:hypothetical protein [Nanoarchaeota archaeon]